MNALSPITTHVLDTSRGRPAAGIAVQLDVLDAEGQWRTIAQGVTDSKGRISDLLEAAPLERARYRLTFATGEYYSSLNIAPFFPRILVEFEVATPDEHFHIPLLLSRFGYSIYRGS